MENKVNEDVATVATDIDSGLTFTADVVSRAYQQMLTMKILGTVFVDGPSDVMFFSRKNGNKKDIIQANVDMESLIIKTNVSKEFFQDIQSQMSKNGEEFLLSLISQDLLEDVDTRTLKKLDDISFKEGDLILDALSEVEYKRKFEHIAMRIVSSLNEINSKVKRGGTGFAVVSSKVASALMMTGEVVVNSDKTQAERDVVGKLYGYIDIYIDTDENIPEDYCLVGYKANSAKLDSGLVYIVYQHNVEVLDDYSIEENTVYVRERSNILRNPLDSGSGISDSDFYRKFKVDFENIDI